MAGKIDKLDREILIKKEYKDGELLHLDAIQELEKIGYKSIVAENIVERWLEELQDGDVS